jgi:hypothetical protein
MQSSIVGVSPDSMGRCASATALGLSPRGFLQQMIRNLVEHFGESSSG